MMNSSIDLNQLALFVRVVEAGSFAEAARRLQVPANTVSRQVQQLEDRLGVRLMQRSTRKLTLTEAGLSLHQRAATHVDELGLVAAQAARRGQALGGTVRVATPADFFEYFSAAWVAEFLLAHPAIRLELLMSDAKADLIGDGIDVALRGGTLDDSNLIARKLTSFPITLVASPEYLAARGMPQSVAALVEHDCIKSTKPGTRTPWRLVGPQGTVEVLVSGRVSAGTALAQLRAALAGLGIGLVPLLLSCREIDAGHLVAVLPQHGLAWVDLYAVYPSRRLLAPAVSAFIEFSERKLKEELLPLIEARLR